MNKEKQKAFASAAFYRRNAEYRATSRRAINRIGDANKVVPYRKPLYAASGLSSSRIVYKPQINKSPPLP